MKSKYTQSKRRPKKKKKRNQEYRGQIENKRRNDRFKPNQAIITLSMMD